MTSPPRKSPAKDAFGRPIKPPASPEPTGTTFRSTLGALAVAAGIGAMGAYMLDLHGHTCDRCGRRWRHFGAFNLGDEESHTCGRCGEVQWWKCGAPHVLRGSEFVEPARSLPALVTPSRIASPGPTMAASFGNVVASRALPPAPPSAPTRGPLLALQPRRGLR